MLDFLQDAGNYQSRKVADKVWIKGIGISTTYTSDEGYETALLDDNGAHPVQRYSNKDESIKGHNQWVSKIKKGVKRVIRVGGFGGFVKDKEITLIPRKIN